MRLWMNGLRGGDRTLTPTQWHEFWITIAAGGTGTHLVNIYADGSLTPTVFNVTAGSGTDFSGGYLGLGLGSTPQSGAVDVDFFSYKAGVLAPDRDGEAPAPATVTLLAVGITGLAYQRRKR